MVSRNDAAMPLAALLLAGGALTFQAFVHPPPGASPSRQGTALRGSVEGQDVIVAPNSLPESDVRQRVPSWLQLAGAVGAFALAGRLAAGTSGTRGAASAATGRVICQAKAEPVTEAKPAAEEIAKEEPVALKEPLGYWDPTEEIGVTQPLGYWDPAGFTKKDDEASFQNLRAAEVKHGRVAMMAAVGAVAQHFIRFPGFEGAPAGLNAVLTPPGSFGVIMLLVVAGGVELGLWTESPDKEPGNFGDPLSLGMYDEEMRNRELNNGRFAMFAAVGIIAAELLTGKDAVLQLGL